MSTACAALLLPVVVFAAAASRGAVPLAMAVRLLIVLLSIALALAARQWGWAHLAAGDFAIRVTATLAAIWAVIAWTFRPSFSEPGAAPTPAQRGAAVSSSCLHATLLLATASATLIVARLATSLWDRIPGASLDAEPLGTGLPRGPISDLAALGLALLFWRLTQRDRLQPTILFMLCGLLVAWLSLMIPGDMMGSSDELLPPRPGRRPAWWTWTINLQAGLALLLSATAIIRTRIYQRRRRPAWPDRLELLLAPYPSWPGFATAFAFLAAIVLVDGVYHLVRPSGLSPWPGMVSLAAAASAGVSCLVSAHRRWNENVAGLGLTLIALGVVTLPSMFATGDASSNYAERLPPRLNAALFGLAFMAFLYLWLAGFWQQQLHDGQPWTTTGRLIPLAERAGFMIAALGVLVAFHMAMWPRSHRIFAPDATKWRWFFGVTGMLTLAAVTSRAARKRDSIPLATLCIATLIGVGLFAFVRWPATDERGWLVQHFAIVLAMMAIPTLLLAEAAPRWSWRPFATPLWWFAVLGMPAVALSQLIDRPSDAWLRPATLAVLALLYAFAGRREGRRAFFILGVALAGASAFSMIMTYRAGIMPSILR